MSEIASIFNDNYVRLAYDIDIVFVVDATGSMNNLIDTVKGMIPDFYKRASEELSLKNKHVETLRVKVIFFRDFMAYEEDHYAPLMATRFYTLSDQNSNESQILAESIASIRAVGGGDVPEDGLEALASAMRSDWCKSENKKRHMIVLFTDAPTHPLGYGKSSTKYPKNMPENFEQLTEMWGNQMNRAGMMNYSAKRLILFTPEVEKLPEDDGWRRIIKGRKDPYSETLIEKPWENVISVQINPKNAFQDVDFKKILGPIVNSV